MKKVIFIAIAAVASLASCKKDHTCTCTNPGSSTATVITYTKCLKGDARSQCLSGTVTYGSTAYVRTCTFN